ncbi:SLC13 family permease [Akkermansia sp. N21116]|jgi:sodium-dependent dicarboxylate transporter 2/3/5|uniref:SLC13 family permease n=1 Tax=Akkermansia sp. N21116 TaxID=3040764 RepID=UPI00244EB388|nr:SLC13 family permease [Akkermansia sp. N21116]WPX40731.1 SLC13 family permease [Akkermansia sp. N21116]
MNSYGKIIKALIGIIGAAAVFLIPFDSMGVILSPVEVRVIALFVLAALFWILEPVPIWTTSVLVITLSLLLFSNQSLVFLRYGEDGQKFTNLVDQKATMATFADPIIMLFLGGFFLAAAATKYRLDMNLAKVLLKPFGTNPKFVLLGLMSVTALFSMFMSNTATAAMMLAILAPVLSLFQQEDKGRIAFALAIPIASNIGGMGTPIGTPPNAIALKALQDMGLNVSFGKWMMFGVPFVFLLIIMAWLLLLKLFPISQKSLELKVGGSFLKSTKAIIVYITFAVTVILWVTGSGLHGMDSNTIAMIPIAVFAITQVITKEDLKQMGWDVLWLVAGGFALGLALQNTGLAEHLIGSIPFASWSPFLLMIGTGVICLFMANFMSHTATASLLIPIIAVVGMNMGDRLDPVGGVTALLVSVAFASSLGMCLPISTPPNALAYATGLVNSKGMAITGVILGIAGMVLTYTMMKILSVLHFL